MPIVVLLRRIHSHAERGEREIHVFARIHRDGRLDVDIGRFDGLRAFQKLRFARAVDRNNLTIVCFDHDLFPAQLLQLPVKGTSDVVSPRIGRAGNNATTRSRIVLSQQYRRQDD